VVLSGHTFLIGLLVLSARHAVGWLERLDAWAIRNAPKARRLMPTTPALVPVVDAIPWFRLVVCTAGVAWVVVVWTHVGGYASGADQSGYMNSARLLAAGRVTTPMRAVPALPPATMPRSTYMPLGFRVTGNADLAPTYPIGLPLVVMAVAQVTGWERAADVTMVLFALAGVALTFWLARECGLSPPVSALAALILATSPLYFFMSLTLMSDTPALVWTTAAILLAWRSRDDARWAVLSGVALSLAVLTRPTDILAIVPLAVCLGVSPRRWIWLAAGGMPGAALLLRYNMAAYGAAVTTGYGDVTSLFGPQNVALSLSNYIRWLPVLLTPIGVLAPGLPALVRRAPRLVTVLLLWMAVFLVFYLFYYHTHETWWYLRFILPAFPPLIVGSLWVTRVLLERWTSRRRMPTLIRGARGAVILAALIVWHNFEWGWWLNAFEAGFGAHAYRQAADWSSTHLPRGAAILAMEVSGSFLYYTDFPVVRWDFLDRTAVDRIETEAAAGRLQLYAVLFPYEITDLKFFTRIPGTWERVEAIRHVTVWRFTGRAAP
jgi:hypothetical protein